MQRICTQCARICNAHACNALIYHAFTCKALAHTHFLTEFYSPPNTFAHTHSMHSHTIYATHSPVFAPNALARAPCIGTCLQWHVTYLYGKHSRTTHALNRSRNAIGPHRNCNQNAAAIISQSRRNIGVDCGAVVLRL